MEGSSTLAADVLAAAAAGDLAFRLSNTVHSSAFRNILCLTRCFLRLDVLPWPALHFASQILQRALSASSLEKCNHTCDRFRLAIAPDCVVGSNVKR